MDEKEIEQLFEAFKKQVEALGGNFEELYANIRLRSKTETDAKLRIAEMALGVDKFNKAFKKESAEITKNIKKLKQDVSDGSITLEELDEQLKLLRDQINKTTDVAKKQSLLEQKYELEKINASQQSSKIFGNSMMQLGGTVVKGVANSFMAVAKSALAGGDAIEQTGQFMSAQVDMANQATQVGAGALTQFGQATAGAGGKLKYIGIAATLAGETLSLLGNTVSELAKAGISLLVSGVRKLLTGFSELSSAGAVYAGGMMTQVKVATEAGMTMEQFSKAVSNNTDALTRSGLGVAEGAKRMAAAMKTGGEAARNGMYALGMSMDDQAAAYATTMARMAGPEGRLTSSNKEVADQTQEYARNLKLISDITGKSAKAQQDQADAATSSLRMQQELMKMDPKARASFQEALGAMGKDSVKAMQDRIAHDGMVTDKTTAILEQASPALKQLHEEEYRLAKAGKLNAATDAELSKKYAAAITKQIGDQTALGTAAATAGSNLAEVDAAGGELVKHYSEFGDVDVKAREAAIKAEQDAGKKGKSDAAALMAAEQKNALAQQGLVVANLGRFKTALAKTTEFMDKAFKALGELSKQLPQTSWWSSIALALLPALVAPFIELAIGKMTGKGPYSGGTRIAETLTGGAEVGGLKKNKAGQWIHAKTGQYASKADIEAHTKPAAKTGGMLEGLGKGISSIGKGVGDTIGAVLKGLAGGLKELGSPKVMLGTVTLGLLAGAIFISAKAFKQFADVKWGDIGKGLVAILAVGALGALAGAASEFIIPGAIALGMLGGAIWLLGKALKEFPSGILPDMTGAFQKIGDVIGSVVDTIGSAFSWVWGKIKDVGSWIKQEFSDLMDFFKPVTDFIGGLFTGMGNIVKGVFGWISDTASSVGKWISDTFSSAVNSVTSFFDGMGTKIMGVFNWVGEKASALGKWLSGIFSWDNFKSGFDSILSGAGKVIDGIKGFFSSFADGVKGVFAWLWDKISAIVDTIKGAAKTVASWFSSDDKKDKNTTTTTATNQTPEKQATANASLDTLMNAANLFASSVEHFATAVTGKDMSGSISSPGVKNVAGATANMTPAQAAEAAKTGKAPKETGDPLIVAIHQQTAMLHEMLNTMNAQKKYQSQLVQLAS